MLDAAPALEAQHQWLESWEGRLPTLDRPGPLAWRRDGLMMLYNRLEVLKTYDSQLTQFLVEAQAHLGRARAWVSLMGQEVDNVIGPDIESRAGMMVNRGMASEERWLAHRTRAAVPWSAKRSFERNVELLEAAVEIIKSWSWNVRDERNDIRAQLRAINVAIEIGEL